MMNTRNASTILRLAGKMKRSRFRIGCSVTLTPRIIAAFGRSSVRLALIVLAIGFFLPTAWSGRVFSHSRAVVATTEESVGLFADQNGNTPQTVFNQGDKVWAIETGAPLPFLGIRQRRFQWVAPDGTVKQQSDITTDGQPDSYQLLATAQVGTWRVKTIDNSNGGFAVAEFVVHDPAHAAADLSVNIFGASLVPAGGSFTHRVQVTNNGPDAAQGVQLTDTVSGGATFQSLTGSEGWSCEGGDTTTCSPTAPLAKGETAVFTLVYQVSDTLPAETIISNMASVSSTTTELQDSDNSTTATTTVTVSTCTFTCPTNITLPHDAGMSGATVNYATPTISSGCDPVICTPPSDSVFPAGITAVICSSQNGGSCSFTVTVTGTVTITLNGPDPFIVECHTQFIDPGAIAQDGSGNPVQVNASGSVDVNTPGTYTITYTDVTNTAMTTRTVNVVDTTPPVLICPNVVAILPPNTTDTSMVVNYPNVIAIESCSSATITSPPAPVSGSTFQLGSTTLTASAADAAGNANSCSFTVTVAYNFSGFFQPISNPPTLNVVNAGRAIPVKFSLSGNKGLNIFAPDYPVSGDIPCDTANPLSDVQETVTASGSSLSYDPATDQYSYVWKTDAAWAGTCRQLVIKLNDGTEHLANFKFR